MQVSWNPEKWYMWHHAAWCKTSAITDSWMHSLFELLIMGIYLIIYFLINFRSTMDCRKFTVWYLLHFMKIWLYLKSLPYTKNQRNLILKMYTVSVAFMSSNRKCLSKYFSLIVFQLIYLQQSILRNDWLGISPCCKWLVMIYVQTSKDICTMYIYYVTDNSRSLLI